MCAEVYDRMRLCRRKRNDMNGSTVEYSRRLDGFGRAPATDLPTHDVDRDGATKASPQAKAAKRVVRNVATRMLMVVCR